MIHEDYTMAVIPNPNNGYEPKLKEIVKVVGGCHPAILDNVGMIVKIHSPDNIDWMYYNGEWLFTCGKGGGFAPATEEEKQAFLAIPNRPDWFLRPVS